MSSKLIVSPTNQISPSKDEAKVTSGKAADEPILSPLFLLVNSNDVSGAEKLLATGSASVRDTDSSGMTALMHAAYKGHTDMCKMLLKQGSDVNADGHCHSYSPLHFAALSSSLDTTQLILDAGARTYKTNSVGRTAAQMAGFVGHSRCVAIINNHVDRAELKKFTQPTANNQTTTLDSVAEQPLYDFITQVNLHPVHLAQVVSRSGACLLQHLHAAAAVLHALSKQEATRPSNVNEVLCLKFHYLGYLLDQLDKEHEKYEIEHAGAPETAAEEKEHEKYETVHAGAPKTTAEDGACAPQFHDFLKRLVRCRPSDGAELWQEKWVRDAIKAFHALDMPLFLQLVRSLSGKDTQALSVLSGAINGQRGFAAENACGACGEDSKDNKSCAKCKAVLYCDRHCQKLHWSSHKKFCAQLGTTVASRSSNKENNTNDSEAKIDSDVKTKEIETKTNDLSVN